MNEILDTNFDKMLKTPEYRKILLVNLGILAAYTFYCFVFTSKGDGAILDAFLIVGHVSICILLGIIAAVASKRDTAKGLFLSALLVLLIGFGTCVSFGSLSGL